MESTFLCKENLENIYEYLNSQTVHSYNVNLDSNPKYKKIVKKLAKTIFKNLYSTVQNMTINEFNDLVVNKSIPFIKQNIDKDLLKVKAVDSNNNSNNIQNFNSHNVNYAEVDLSNLNNIDLTSSVTLSKDNKDNKDNKKKTKRAKKQKKKSDNDEYQEYLNDAIEFENLIRKSNDKIKDNFKQLVKKTNNNFVKDCNIEDTNPFVMDRCATKDDVIEKGLSKSAFEQIVEKKTLDNINTTKPLKLTRTPGANNTNPTLAFGDGNTGFYERSDNDLRVTVGGVNYWEFSANCMGNVSEGKAHFNSETATATNPSVIPWRNDSDTGIGRASANNLSLIAGGTETLRLGSNLATFNVGNSGATVFDVQGSNGQLFSVIL